MGVRRFSVFVACLVLAGLFVNGFLPGGLNVVRQSAQVLARCDSVRAVGTGFGGMVDHSGCVLTNAGMTGHSRIAFRSAELNAPVVTRHASPAILISRTPITLSAASLRVLGAMVLILALVLGCLVFRRFWPYGRFFRHPAHAKRVSRGGAGQDAGNGLGRGGSPAPGGGRIRMEDEVHARGESGVEGGVRVSVKGRMHGLSGGRAFFLPTSMPWHPVSAKGLHHRKLSGRRLWRYGLVIGFVGLLLMLGGGSSGRARPRGRQSRARSRTPDRLRRV